MTPPSGWRLLWDTRGEPVMMHTQGETVFIGFQGRDTICLAMNKDQARALRHFLSASDQLEGPGA